MYLQWYNYYNFSCLPTKTLSDFKSLATKLVHLRVRRLRVLYRITNPVLQSKSWEVKMTQRENVGILPLPVDSHRNLSSANEVSSTTSHAVLTNISFNIILPSMPKSSKWPLYWGYPNDIRYAFFAPWFYVPYLSDSPSSVHTNKKTI